MTDMNRYSITRREFVESATLGLLAMAMPSCVSPTDGSRGDRSFSFAQVCDTQLGFGSYERDLVAFKQAVTQINALGPDFVLICGDLVNTPDEQSYADFNRIRSGLEVPCYCAPGNHDVGNSPTQESLRRYRTVVGEDYYSFEHEGCVFVIVNTSLWKSPLKGESEKHDSWLEATLEGAARDQARIFLVGHHPLFLSQPDEADQYYNLLSAKRGELLGLIERQGVVAVLGGHTHKLLINEYRGIQLVNAETTSKNFDKRPLGFRLWHVEDTRPYECEFLPLDNV